MKKIGTDTIYFLRVSIINRVSPYFFIFVLALAGCSGPSKPTLTVTMSLSEQEWQVIRHDVLRPFEKLHGIKIKSYQIEAGQLPTKLEALKLAGKSQIDVFAQDNMSLSILINKDLVLDLSAYQSRIPKEVMPGLIGACKFDDKLLFMPFRPNVQITYYNKEAFDKYGLEIPWDWYDLLEAAKVFKEKEGTGRVLLKGYGGNPTATQLYELVLQAGGDPYAFDDLGCVEAFEFLKSLSPYLSPESKRAKWDTTNEILARREAYIAQNWPFGVEVLVKNYGLDFIKTYSGWGGPAGEVHVIGGDVFGIAKNTKDKELALEFISYMQSREVQEILVSKLAWPSIRDDAYAQVTDWQKAHFEAVREALNYGTFRKNVTWWPLYAKYVTQAFNDIVMEGAEVRKTLEKYKDEIREKVSF